MKTSIARLLITAASLLTGAASAAAARGLAAGQA